MTSFEWEEYTQWISEAQKLIFYDWVLNFTVIIRAYDVFFSTVSMAVF